MFHHISFDSEISSEFTDPRTKSTEALKNLSQINIFVGGNNSGKSRILRYLASAKFSAIQSYPDLEKECERVLVAHNQSNGFNNHHRWPECVILSDEQNGQKILDELVHQSSTPAHKIASSHALTDLLIRKVPNPSDRNYCLNNEEDLRDFNQRWKNNLEQMSRKISHSSSASPPIDIKNQLASIYIPILRGLRPLIEKKQLLDGLSLGQSKNPSFQETVSITLERRIEALFGERDQQSLESFADFYQSATERDYPELRHKNCSIYTGLAIYWDIQRLLLGNQGERERVRNFEHYLSENFFEKQDIELIPSLKTPGVLHVKIGVNDDQVIHKLGDGIQAMIAILYPIFTQIKENQPTIVCIEEPELNLHAGLQRQLIKALQKFKNVQFFITTHSNHLLETIFDYDGISLYRVRKDYLNTDSKVRDYTEFTQILSGDRSILNDLGVINTSVLLSNCTIWVEGVTDRHLFRHYLELYIKQHGGPNLIEGKHFSFVEYAGSNITHWSFLDEEASPIEIEALCGEAFLIVDGDNVIPGTKKAIRHSQLKNKLGKRFFKLKCKETENLLNPEILEKIVSAHGVDDTSFQFGSKWKTYADKPLGTFLDQTIKNKNYALKKNGKYTRKFADGSTINNKGDFCRKAIEHTLKFDQLSPEAQRLTRAIYNFILNENR